MTPRIKELSEMAGGMYLTIKSLTETPQEAVNVVCMIHLLIYMNHGSPDSNVDGMLGDYCRNFKHNWKQNKANAQ